jgi:hypothetical protein
MNPQQICKSLIGIVRARIAEVLKCQQETLPELALGRAINLLFLVRGESLSLGEYGPTMASTYALVGDLLWTPPGQFPEEETATTAFVQ